MAGFPYQGTTSDIPWGAEPALPPSPVLPYICGAMPDKVHSDFHACPACNGKGTVPSRLPFRTKRCDHCNGRGVVPPRRPEALLKALAQRPVQS